MTETARSSRDALKLRAHHICCVPHLQPFRGRGKAFEQMERRIKEALCSPSNTMITAVEGTDDLCQHCPLCIDHRCASPRGNEDEVRKWDAIILKELGASSGTCFTATEWRSLIKKKSPLRLCRKCQWRQNCQIGAGLS